MLIWIANQPFDFLRSKARGLLSLPAGRQGLILSGAFDHNLRGGVWRRRSVKFKIGGNF
jgi:hypothetical protein